MTTGTHVIIGGLGSLGRCMQRALLSAGKTVRVLDLPRKDCERHLVYDGIDFVPCDVSRDDIARALKGAETVYLMATPSLERGTRKEMENTNVLGAKRVIDACKAAKVSKLILASSIAVTDHLAHSRNVREDDPLPAIGSYQSWYDKTKRLGEELVLAANGKGSLLTCALRIGGVISTDSNYLFRRRFQGGRMVTVQSNRMDFIAAKDVCSAMIQADKKLDDPATQGLAGEALFVTKSADQQPVRTSDLVQYLAEILHWKNPAILPSEALGHLSKAVEFKDACRAWRAADSDDLRGVPQHLVMRISSYEKTFDNSRARHILDFEPRMTWRQAIEDIAEEEYDLKP